MDDLWHIAYNIRIPRVPGSEYDEAYAGRFHTTEIAID